MILKHEVTFTINARMYWIHVIAGTYKFKPPNIL